jgi:uncharacterized membrane protein
MVLRLIVFSCLGVLTEVIFTGLKSALFGNKNATSQTYLWMFPIYGVSGLIFSYVWKNVSLSYLNFVEILIKTLICVFFVYAVEALSGLLIKSLIGTIPWDYGESKLTPLGLVNFKYFGFWFLLCIVFPKILPTIDLLEKAFLI